METGKKHEKRAQTKMSVKNNRLTISIDAKDAAARNASQHSYTQMVTFLDTLIE